LKLNHYGVFKLNQYQFLHTLTWAGISHTFSAQNSQKEVDMTGQKGGWIWASSDDAYVYSKTVQVDPKRETRAEIALTHVHEYALAVVSQIVSNSGVEEPSKPVVHRSGVTSVTFSLLVDDSGASARWLLHFWS
jgi:hypothetical protein